MHEYAVTKNIVEIAENEAKAANASCITVIKLVIGDLSSIIDESVAMYFELISRGTMAEGARLQFERRPAVLFCPRCRDNFNKPDKGFECPGCGSTGTLTDAGREFYIESLEVE